MLLIKTPHIFIIDSDTQLKNRKRTYFLLWHCNTGYANAPYYNVTSLVNNSVSVAVVFVSRS